MQKIQFPPFLNERGTRADSKAREPSHREPFAAPCLGPNLMISVRSWYEVNTVSTDLIAFLAFTKYSVVVPSSKLFHMSYGLCESRNLAIS